MGVKQGLSPSGEELRLRVFENRALRRIFGPKRGENGEASQFVGSRGSSVSIVTRLWAGRPGFNSRQGLRFFLLANPASYPMDTGIGGSFPRVKRPGHEADHSPQSVPRLRMRGALLPLPKYVFMAWCLIKHRTTLQFIGLLFTTIIRAVESRRMRWAGM
jgi:hypothetical protein